MFGLVWSLLILIALLVALYILLRPLMRGAVYYPTSGRGMANMMELLAPKAGERIVDIGSGDGRILIALAEHGAEAHGYEINPLLVVRSRRAIRARGLAGKAFVYWKDFWRADLGKFDAVIVYGFPNIMGRLGEKLKKELKPGTKVLSNDYHISDWEPVIKKGRIYLYEVK